MYVNLTKPALTDDVLQTMGVDLPINFQKIEDAFAKLTNEIIAIKNRAGMFPGIMSWPTLQSIVRSGEAGKYIEIGDIFIARYGDAFVAWRVIGIDHDTPVDSQYTHSLTIQTVDCLADIQFDAPEPTNPDENRQEYGNNRYLHSAIKQWLNSNEDTFQWVSQHQYDAPPSGSIYEGPGFLKLLDPDLAAVIGAVNKQVARNTATDGGGQDLFSDDKVFLLSRVEAGLGTEGVTDGEVVYPYYDGISDAGRIKLLNGSPRIWWLRSPYVSYSLYVRGVSTDGTVNYNYARHARGLAPACCII